MKLNLRFGVAPFSVCLNGNVGIQMIGTAVALFAAFPSTCISAVNFPVSSALALTLPHHGLALVGVAAQFFRRRLASAD